MEFSPWHSHPGSWRGRKQRLVCRPRDQWRWQRSCWFPSVTRTGQSPPPLPSTCTGQQSDNWGQRWPGVLSRWNRQGRDIVHMQIGWQRGNLFKSAISNRNGKRLRKTQRIVKITFNRDREIHTEREPLWLRQVKDAKEWRRRPKDPSKASENIHATQHSLHCTFPSFTRPLTLSLLSHWRRRDNS